MVITAEETVMQYHFIVELNMYNQVEDIAKVLYVLDILLHHRGSALSSRPESSCERLLRRWTTWQWRQRGRAGLHHREHLPRGAFEILKGSNYIITCCRTLDFKAAN